VAQSIGDADEERYLFQKKYLHPEYDPADEEVFKTDRGVRFGSTDDRFHDAAIK
jgi:hypothetical protein